MRVTCLVTHKDDPRVERTVASLLGQTRAPDEILVADGGSRAVVLGLLRDLERRHPLVRVVSHPGRVADTRAGALADAHGEVVAFLDADEVAPPGWLAALVAPIVSGAADFAGGPTRPAAPPRSRTEAYVNRFDAWFYAEEVARDIASLPMGNSAWAMAVFRAIGSFDRRLSMGGEDFDVNLRALAAGFRGRFVPDAWVFHDQSHLASFGAWLRRKHRYHVGAALAYLKNGVLRERTVHAARVPARFPHPYEWIGLVSRAVALIQAWAMWRRLGRDPAPRGTTRERPDR